MVEKQGWRGRYYEDFEVGDVYEHPLGRTITDADNTWFTLLTMNTHPLHFNTDYAKKTEYGKCLVNSLLTLSVVTGLSVTDTSQNAMANLGWEEVRLPSPVYVGDTLYARSEVLEVRESKSLRKVGIVKIKTVGYNQEGKAVIEFKRAFLSYKRAYHPTRRARLNPRASGA